MDTRLPLPLSRGGDWKTWLASSRCAPLLEMPRTLQFVWQSGPRWTVLSLILLVIQGVLPLIALYLMKLIVDAVAAGALSAHKPAAMRHVLLIIGSAGGVALLSGWCDSLARMVTEIQAQVVTDHMQGLLHAKAVEVDLEYYERADYHDLLHRAQQEGASRPTRLVGELAQVAQAGLSLLGIGLLLIGFHWGAAAAVLVAALPGAALRLRFTEEMHQSQRRLTAIERRAHYLSCLLTLGNFAKEVRLLGLGSFLMTRYRKQRLQIRDERVRLMRRRCRREQIGQTLATLPLFGTYALIAYSAVQGSITLGSLVMYFQALQRGQGLLQSLLASAVGLYEDNLFIAHVHRFFELAPKVASPAKPKAVPRPLRSGIVFEHVGFRYPGSDRAALKEVDLTIRPGQVVALVGENGSGKTTLVKLLCRLYDPTQGTIHLDGVDMRSFDVMALRREISVVFQDYVNYHMTARENIWLGDVTLPAQHERITDAARRAGADEIIRHLKNGYDTSLGKWLEEGEELSVGQWQKIALARAFLRDSQLIILDEPTSALDPRAEAEVFDRFRELIDDRTAILISHRLSTVKMADLIYVLSNGRIAESGTHDELMGQGGVYADLFNVQARAYR